MKTVKDGRKPNDSLYVIFHMQKHDISPSLSEVHDHDVGLLDDASDDISSAGHGGAVDDAVVSTPAKVADLLLDNVILLVKGRDGAHAADAENGNLTLDNDGAQDGATDVANVGDCDGAARHVVGGELALLGKALEAVELGGNGDDVERADVLDDRDDEALGRVHGDTNVVLGAHDEGRLVVVGLVELDAGVEDGELVEGEGDGLDDEGEVGELGQLAVMGVLGEDLVESTAQAHEVGEVNLVGVEEVGDGEGARHALEHHLLCLGERLLRLRLNCSVGGGRSGSGGRLAAGSSVSVLDKLENVLLGDATVLAGAVNLVDVNLELLGQVADGRGRDGGALALLLGLLRGGSRRLCRSGRRGLLICGRGSSRSILLGGGGRRGSFSVGSAALDVNVDKGLADLGHLAGLVVELLDGAGEAAGNFDRGLVALDLTERGEFLDTGAGLDEPLDDLTFDDACLSRAGWLATCATRGGGSWEAEENKDIVHTFTNIGQKNGLDGAQASGLGEPSGDPGLWCFAHGDATYGSGGTPLRAEGSRSTLKKHDVFSLPCQRKREGRQKKYHDNLIDERREERMPRPIAADKVVIVADGRRRARLKSRDRIQSALVLMGKATPRIAESGAEKRQAALGLSRYAGPLIRGQTTGGPGLGQFQYFAAKGIGFFFFSVCRWLYFDGACWGLAGIQEPLLP